MIIDKIGQNKYVQKFIQKTSDKKFYEKLNHSLPLIESGFSTLSYVGAIELNKKIPDERKKPLVWQSIIGGAVGIAVSKKLDNYARKHTDRLCVELEKLNIPKPKNTINGLRMLGPILITTLVLRYGVSVLSVPISTQITKLQNKLTNKK